jgi:peptidoglycan/LPS O-acetylase OafA/YrhL
MSALFFLLLLYGMLRPCFEKMPACSFAVLSLIYWAVAVSVSCILIEQSVAENLRVVFYNPLIHLSSFLLGAALQGLVSPRRHGLVVLLVVIGLFGICALFLYLNPVHFGLISGGCLWAPVFCLLVYGIFLAPSAMVQCFDHRVIALLGELSFPIYLLQFPMHKLYETIFVCESPSGSLRFFGYLSFLIMTAVLCHVFLKFIVRRTLTRSGFLSAFRNHS